MWTGQHNGLTYVAMRSLRSSSRLQWWAVKQSQEIEIEAGEVPERVRRRAYRSMWTARNIGAKS